MKFNLPFIIAEIGINHDGKFSLAKKLIKMAKKGGADAVKFQLFDPSDLYLSYSKNYKLLKKFCLNKNEIKKLRVFSKKINIKFFCTAFSYEGVNFLNKINVDALKIASMDNINFSLIDKSLKTKKPVIISTGMLDLKKLKKVLNKYKKNKKIFFLHCISNYPNKDKNHGFGVFKLFKNYLKKNKAFGFSDHSQGNDACKIAIAKGAKIIEKHFTLRKRDYFDHSHSMDYDDLKNLSNFKFAYYNNDNFKDYLKNRSDLVNQKFFRRGIYAKKAINRGAYIAYNDLSYVRPLNNKLYLDLNEVIGKKSKIKIKKNSQIDKKDLIK